MKKQSYSRPIDYFIYPNDKGEKLLHYINQAKKSIRIIIYEIGCQVVNNALIEARKRGVNIYILINSNFFGQNYKFNKALTLRDALQAMNSTAIFEMRYSSDYFQLTHQSSLIIDDSLAIVMSGSLASYSNENDDFWSTIEIGLVVDELPVIAEILEAFNQDWNNIEPSDKRKSMSPCIWSAGLIKKKPMPHGMCLYDTDTKYTQYCEPRGNYMQTVLTLIRQAKKTIHIFEEELQFTPIITEILNIATKSNVQIFILTNNSTRAQYYAEVFVNPNIHFMISSKLYCHAKIVLVDGAYLLAGSGNFSLASIFVNRELGLLVDGPIAESIMNDLLPFYSNEGVYRLETTREMIKCELSSDQARKSGPVTEEVVQVFSTNDSSQNALSDNCLNNSHRSNEDVSYNKSSTGEEELKLQQQITALQSTIDNERALLVFLVLTIILTNFV